MGSISSRLLGRLADNRVESGGNLQHDRMALWSVE